jgi:hypothetical protein
MSRSPVRRETESPAGTADDLVRLLDATPAADDKIAAALLHGASHLPLAGCLEIATRMESEEKRTLIRTALQRMRAYDAAPRAFEHAGLTFELVVSATCFAQVKRHRMATITVQEYDPALDVTVPPNVAAIGMESAFREICARTEETWEKIPGARGAATSDERTGGATIPSRPRAPPRPRRADGHAQWDIEAATDGGGRGACRSR